ncbi:MerR family transcriptional regulator [Bacillus massilinigeriensis]|uniref:MerR family transcriptional regulator n=1 Tax=Bacillus massilionigeriensis TaxID=1805475 RepID=UPI00096B5E5E|nr:MerR family DNA-binding transcriptional regulator [Bacillus massilionigeriensis]
MRYDISKLAEEFKVSTRTIRYYEELGLLKPERSESGKRLFSKKDYTRLRLIFRGKRYGFQLDEIKEMIELFDKDRTGVKQLEKTITFGKEKIKEVNERIEELTLLKGEMEKLIHDFEERLRNGGK